jgi:uncharacterized membrane protein affecting hemolysin expression
MDKRMKTRRVYSQEGRLLALKGHDERKRLRLSL